MITGQTGLEGAISTGLNQLTQQILARAWTEYGGTRMRIERCLVITPPIPPYGATSQGFENATQG